MSDTRYPYTYACDYVRSTAGFSDGNATLSRAKASQVISGIATALNMSHAELATKLADYYKVNESKIVARTTINYMKEVYE